jgi:hypothetical protein
MSHFLSVFAAIDMKHELLLGKYVVGVERTLSLLSILSLFEHPPIYYMPRIDSQHNRPHWPF